jgi:hypothetical protein
MTTRPPQPPFVPPSGWDEAAQVAIDAATRQRVALIAAIAIPVTQANQLADALRQHEKPVVIEDDQLKSDFVGLLRWNEREKTYRIAFVATLIALVLSMAIANKYHLEFSWHQKWKVEEIGGKITLTPSSGVKQRGTDDPRDSD